MRSYYDQMFGNELQKPIGLTVGESALNYLEENLRYEE